MKNLSYTLLALITAFLVAFGSTTEAQVSVDQWGAIGRFGWPIIPNATPGSAGMGGTGTQPSGNWATLRGAFGPLTATETEAVVVTGKVEFVGGGPTSWSALRYGIFRHDSPGTLQYAGTDTARWDGQESGAYGYMFTPSSGGNVPVGWANGGNGTHGAINGGSWISTNGAGGSMGTVNQAPLRAEMTAGVYNWAFSVRHLSDGTNEVKWYIVKDDNSYWFGGTDIDTFDVTDTFNGVIFGINNGNDIGATGITGLNVSEVQAGLGEPITVPEAPWESYYIDQWGLTAQGSYWPIQNDSSTLVGDGSILGTAPLDGAGWATIQGGFGQDLPLKTDEALIVTGQLEFVGTEGGGSEYTPIRYAISYLDSATLNNPLTDSAAWVGTGYSGYGFHPRTGAGTVSNGNGGSGTVWTINNGSWNSTYGNNGKPIAYIVQAPRNAEIIPGTYDFAFSIRQIDSISNEIKWYLIEENNGYWFGGSVIDTATTDKFNNISFGINTGDWTEFKVIAAQVDYGEPITVPEAPFQAYYLDTWGFFGNNMGGWTFTPGELTGNASISGDAPNTEGVALRGEFQTFTPNPDRPFKITGKVEFVGGGFDASSSFRLGVFYTDSAGTLVVDTAAATQPDSSHWTGTDNYSSGYLFIPQSGSNGPVDWNGSQGTYGGVVNTVWLSPNESNNYVLGNQVPNPSTGGAGTYDFEISVTPQGDGTSIVKCNFFNDNLNWIVSTVDNHSPLATDKFNSIAFALDAGNSITALNVTDVQIDSGTITDVDDLGNTAIPVQYSLSQNYPNPFNPSTTIEFALPQASKVSLVVYDVLGREVAKLADGNFNAGYQKINFNASNLASGVYFYRLKAGDFVSVKKLMLLK